MTVLQNVRLPLIPNDAHVLTVLVNHPGRAHLDTRHIASRAVQDSAT